MDVNQRAPVLAIAGISIEAPADVVWQVLSDIRNWPQWNPSVSTVSMYGELVPGTDFHWKADGVSIVSQLEVVDEPKRIVWTGKSPGIRAVHVWELDGSDGVTQVNTRECFEGLMARLLSGPLKRMLDAALEKGLLALKQESEQRVSASSE